MASATFFVHQVEVATSWRKISVDRGDKKECPKEIKWIYSVLFNLKIPGTSWSSWYSGKSNLPIKVQSFLFFLKFQNALEFLSSIFLILWIEVGELKSPIQFSSDYWKEVEFVRNIEVFLNCMEVLLYIEFVVTVGGLISCFYISSFQSLGLII